MALSADRNTPTLGAGGVPTLTNYPVYTGVHIYKGSLVCLNSSGYLVPGSTSTTLKAVGMALENVDNTTGSSGDLYCQVKQGVSRWANGNSITFASVGSLAWVVDDQTVSSSASGKSVAGTIYLVDSQGVWVYTGLAAPLDATALTDFITELASTSTAEGASLVGVEDSGSLLTAANVEAALAEIVKKANAANGVPFNFQIALSAIVTATTNIVTFRPPTAGKLLRLDAVPIVAPTTADKAVTFTVKITGAASTATLAVTTTTLAVAGTLVTGVTAASGSYAANTNITIAPSAVTTFVEGQILLSLYVQSA